MRAHTIIRLSVIGLFVYWFFRTYHNLQSLGVKGLRYSAKRVIISFFIIGLNLFEPIKGLKDLWKGSDPLVDISDGYSWKKAAVPTGLGGFSQLQQDFMILPSLELVQNRYKRFGIMLLFPSYYS